MLQIFLCFLRNKTKAASHPAWIASKIQKYAPTLCAFLLDEQVDFRGALRLLCVKRPLVALEKDSAEHFCRVWKRFCEKFVLESIRPYAHIAGQRLLIGAGNIPTEFCGGKAVLPVVEIDKADARPHKHPQRPNLTLWIHAIPVSCRFAAGGDHELIAVKNNKAGGLAFSGFVDAGQSGHTAMQCEKVKSSEPFQNGNALFQHSALQRFRHIF